MALPLKVAYSRQNLVEFSDDQPDSYQDGGLSASQEEVLKFWPKIMLKSIQGLDCDVLESYLDPRDLDTAEQSLNVKDNPQYGNNSGIKEQELSRNLSSDRPRRWFFLIQDQTENHSNDETPNQDDYLFCHSCSKEYDEHCPAHPLVLLLNEHVERGGSVAERAKRTTPWPLTTVPPSCAKVRVAGMGIWANRNLPSEVVLGPYEGRIFKYLYPGQELGFGWKIDSLEEPGMCVMALDKSCSNWLRYINSTKDSSLANLVPFQYKGEIYYKIVKPVERGSELLVYYDDEYHCEAESKNFKIEQKSDEKCWKDTSKKKRRRGFSRRRKLHKGEDNMYCDKCDRTFSQKYYFKLHLAFHSGESRYKCEYCEKTYILSCHLKTHLLTHLGKQPYKCKECGKSFTQASHLNRHQSVHTGEKRYACNICGKKYTQGSYMKVHLRTHTGEKPYQCRKCGKAFIQIYRLKRHIQTHMW